MRSLWMWLYIFCIISALMIVKPMVNALFLSEFGAERLPQAFILVAVMAAWVAVLYSNLLKTSNLHTLIIWTLYISMALFLLFWFLLTLNWMERWALYILYVAVAIFAVITSSQFWIMANVIFNAREAKRLFGFIGSGAIAGGIFGGYLTNFLAPIVGSQNLIFIFLFLLGACLFIINRLWKTSSEGEDRVQIRERNGFFKKLENPLNIILASRHLTLIAALIWISVLVGKLVEYQYSAIASEQIVDPDQLTAFFGFWLSNLSIATLLIQLFFTPRIVGMFGVGTSLFFLPAGILIGTFAIFVFPELWAAVLIKLFDGSLKNSLNKSGMELLALPIAADIRAQAKSFIDVFVDSFATGISGILLLLLTGVLNASTRYVSFLSLIFIGLWLYLITLSRKEYIRSFRLKIESHEQPAQPAIDLSNESILGGILKVLIDGEERQVLETLRMIRHLYDTRFLPGLYSLLHSSSVLVLLEVLKQLNSYTNKNFSNDVETLILHENLDVRTEALTYLAARTPNFSHDILPVYLEQTNYRIRSAALLYAARQSRDSGVASDIIKLKHHVQVELVNAQKTKDQQEVITMKRCCARAIGEAHLKELYPFLHYLLQDTEKQVVASAIIGSGLTREKEFGPALIQLLRDRELWSFSQTALASFGADIVDMLGSHLKNPYVDRQARHNIPKVLAGIELQYSVDTLLDNLDIEDRDIRNQIISALYQLRLRAPQLRYNDPVIIKLVFKEANEYFNTLALLYTQMKACDLTSPGADKRHLLYESREKLVKALEKRLDRKIERIFHLLGLRYPPSDIENAYAGIRSTDTELRANTIEFLDNLLDGDLKKVVIPLAETTVVEDVISKTLQRFGYNLTDEVESMKHLLESDDVTLKRHALSLIEHLEESRYLPLVAKALNDPNSEIHNKAQELIKKFGL
ncbi:hypothetical protein JXA70_12795 [candidate division KSB1 bacterium]|nr:hypothetical protein [candidate division KSB1 bacterium]